MNRSHAPSTSSHGGSRVITRCQVCDADELEPAFFLGYLPPVNQMHAIGSAPAEQPAYPAQVLHCRRCHLVQLGLAVDPHILFPPEYPYTSGSTRNLRENFAELQRQATAMLGLGANDLAVDIGSNDGTLLGNFHQAGLRVRGIEPSRVGELAVARGIPTHAAFFSPEIAARVRREEGPAALVTAANVFAHIEDVHGVVEGILRLLDERGVFVSESHYLLSLLDSLQYDTIYHEHLRYYSLHSLAWLLEAHGLEAIHAQRIATHGGSMRVYAARRGARPVQPSVAAMLAAETAAGIDAARLRDFRARMAQSKLDLHALLAGIKRGGGRVYGIGAPSRASTLIQYTGLDDGILDCVLEIAGSLKLGKYMPGTLIPVLEESRLYEDPPDYALLLSWHIADELMPKIAAQGFRGGFIVPLPEPRIVSAAARA